MSEALYEAKTFEEFWDLYQEIHASRSTRVAHAIATTAAVVMIGLAIARRSKKLALAAPVLDFAIAQLSDRLGGERTQPYRRPLWHARAELRLWRSTIRSMLDGRGGRREAYDLPAERREPQDGL